MRTLKLHIWLSLYLLLSTGLFAQREADNWIFGYCAGLNFTSGDPEPIFISNLENYFNGSVMSDSLGNTLFYFSGNHVWNKNELVMMNGDNILPSTHGLNDRCRIAFPKPGTPSQYYIFSISATDFIDGMYYSVIDMELDGGLGGVTAEKNIRLTAADHAQDKIFVLRNSTGNGYWVITRLFNDDRYASFRVTESGVDPVPVYSPTGLFRELSSGSGPMRVSPDKKYLISCFYAHPYPSQSNIEVNSFNARTGVVTFMYTFNLPDIGSPFISLSPTDCEISPDSKKLYIQWIHGAMESEGIYQYDMTLIENAETFQGSAVRLIFNGGISHLQLSNDGRIYFHYFTDIDLQYFQDKYLGIINKPWENGLNCDVDTLGIYLGGRDAGSTLPTILLDYLYRFEWEANDYCQGSLVHFLPHFVPTPDSVRWFFDEFAPGSVSYELSPTYAFQQPGIHEVSVDIWYPTERFEHTSREIEIFPVPFPDLGPDTLICQGSTFTLYANCIADLYSWSTGQIGGSSITVSDSGTYRVIASFFGTNCAGYDTIHVGFHPAAMLDETFLVITPTTCNEANGSVTGLNALGSPPYAFQWLDLSGNPFGADIDAMGLPAGQYILRLTDGHGCETTSEVYTIEDAGNLEVNQVQTSRPHCFHPDGQIIVSAFSPSGSMLEYSINGGDSYATDSIFNGLPAGSYVVQVRDINGCEGFYYDNPLILEDIPGPELLGTLIIDETDGLQNGSIEITATGNTPQLIYSIYSVNTGLIQQADNGLFTNLPAGSYDCVVRDTNDCELNFILTLENIILTYLHAITDEGGHCQGNTALVPVNVDNFNSVANFHLKLSYNADNLQCEGFSGVHPQLADSLTGWVDQAAGDIHLSWNSPAAVTFDQQEKVADLVFTAKSPGQGELAWYTGAAESYFTNAGGNPIPAEFTTGEVEIYAPPEIYMADLSSACEGQMVSIMGTGWSTHPPVSYQWTYPDGTIADSSPFFFSITLSDAGDYTLMVTDGMHCTEEKTIRIEVSENPVAAFHGTDTLEMHAGDYLEAGGGLSSYHWNTGDTTASIAINAEGMYKVEMESQAGCSGRDSIYVKLISEEIPGSRFYVPNAFTPDGDGVNDVFRAICEGFSIVDFRLSIFDRWGGEVFTTDNITNGWDGRKNGKSCPGGVYVYIFRYTAENIPGEQFRKGNVMLIR